MGALLIELAFLSVLKANKAAISNTISDIETFSNIILNAPAIVEQTLGNAVYYIHLYDA